MIKLPKERETIGYLIVTQGLKGGIERVRKSQGIFGYIFGFRIHSYHIVIGR